MSDYQKQRLNQKIHGKVTEPKKTKWLKRSPVKKKIAEKRAVENEIYRKRRITYLAKHKFCQCGCGRYATEIHHKRGRVGKFRGESLLIVVKFFMAVSDYCHKKITNNPEWAIKMGFSLKRNIKTDKQPIMKKAMFAIATILLVSVAMSFITKEQTKKSLESKWTNATDGKFIQSFTITPFDTTKKKEDTLFYISQKLTWFQLLYKSVLFSDSASDIEKQALLSWIASARPIVPPDTTKNKVKPK